jgi:hypothetical protein
MLEELLKPVAQDKEKYGLKLQPPCDESALSDLRKRVSAELSAELPESYAAFLGLTDGLDYNGLVIYSSITKPIVGYDDRFIEGFVEANISFRDLEAFRKYLVIANSGELLYLYEIASSRSLAVDSISLQPEEHFGSIEEMLGAALKVHLQ